jgi:hypothetical protein
MELHIQSCYNLDLLNLLNILTADPFYTRRHPQVYAEFGEALSEDSRDLLYPVTQALGNAMISPILAFILSYLPDFEEVSLLELMAAEDSLLTRLQELAPRLAAQSALLTPLMRTLAPVLDEAENMGFREYWHSTCLPQIRHKQDELTHFAESAYLEKELAALLGSSAPDEITIYLCALAAPHAIKISGPRYIADISFNKETIFAKALHDVFRPPFALESVRASLDAIAGDPFIRLAFERKDPAFGFPEMDGFLEENVVEAMSLYICQRAGLQDDPYGFLLKHNDGSHVFSVILLDYLQRFPKAPEQPFAQAFNQLVAQMPVGSLISAYQAALENAGKPLAI